MDRIVAALDEPEKETWTSFRELWLKEGEAAGKAVGKAEGLRRGIAGVLAARFPELAAEANRELAKWTDPAALDAVLVGLTRVRSIEGARRLLRKHAPK